MKMKKYFLLMAVALVSWSMVNCSDKDDVADDETGKAPDLSEVAIEKISESGCKGYAKEDVAATRSTSDEGERIEYEAVRDQYLRITHYNSMLNCAGHSIVTTLSVKDGVIEVSENKDTEYFANCSCHYDICYEVGPLEEGRYELVITREKLEVVRFTVDFTPTVKGEIKNIKVY